MNMEDLQDSFTIGTAGDIGSIKVYFNILDADTAQKKIEYALSVYKQLREKKDKLVIDEMMREHRDIGYV